MGSTAINTNSSGGKVAEIRYYPWGTVKEIAQGCEDAAPLRPYKTNGQRLESGHKVWYPYRYNGEKRGHNMLCPYKTNGQRLENDIGLYYYGARWSPGKTPGTVTLEAAEYAVRYFV